jgi:hypothetical protein
MVAMYCVECRQTRTVYRTWTSTHWDGGTAVTGTCPSCGRQLRAVLPEAQRHDAATSAGVRRRLR